ncbi:MAG TPA: tRNA (N(6)-L-threonylcarbamoyladenosine(37)-C(2))-methylthiotransferase MtaB [Candidatus Eisenbacteria bacterium]|nr:tRNA (N(6)-L-threonylcarbamoyladenosine(37)-C(2))-methylthiotransferase MtaB [Candidatus Eisenbacteria bacterium]
MTPRVAILTLGCKVNSYDTATIGDRLREAGCTIVGEDAPADVVIVNSCTVTDAADAESRRLARRARRENPDARIVLTGCYAQTQPQGAAAVEAVDWVVGPSRLERLVEVVTAARPAVPRVEVASSRRLRSVSTFGARTFPGQTRAFLKVQEGCDLFCTFCIVPMARGRSRSLAPRDVLREMEGLAAAGFQEVVLTGVHLGGYGEDLSPRTDLVWLVEALAEQGLFVRIRLSSIDPHEVTERLLRVMAAAPSVCPHLHVPLQAADDGVLGRMRRRYDRALAAERLAMVRELLPDASIGTDLIAGFPGESDAAFERTLAFVEASPITYAHVFPYSVRTGTTAAKLDGKVDPPAIRERARRLRVLGDRKRAEFARRFDGTDVEVLVENTRDPQTGALRGYTRNYLRARLDGPDGLMGRRVTATLAVGARGSVEARVRPDDAAA